MNLRRNQLKNLRQKRIATARKRKSTRSGTPSIKSPKNGHGWFNFAISRGLQNDGNKFDADGLRQFTSYVFDTIQYALLLAFLLYVRKIHDGAALKILTLVATAAFLSHFMWAIFIDISLFNDHGIKGKAYKANSIITATTKIVLFFCMFYSLFVLINIQEFSN